MNNNSSSAPKVSLVRVSKVSLSKAPSSFSYFEGVGADSTFPIIGETVEEALTNMINLERNDYRALANIFQL